MVFRTGASERLRIDSSGHMGLGVTPNSNWPSNDDFKALQIGTGACVFGRGSGDDDRAGLAANYYATGSGNAYLANGHANLIYLNDGNIDFYTAAENSSGAGASLTLSQILRMNTNGNIKIGNNSDRDLGGLSVQRLHIEGTDGGSSAIGLVNNQNSTGQAAIYLSKSRGTSVGSNTIVQEGDPLGSIIFCGSDGNDMISVGAQIRALVDGSPGSNDMPTRLSFQTTPDGSATPTTRVEIKEHGRVQVNLPSSSGSSSLISTAQAIVGTKYIHTVYHNFNQTTSPFAVNSVIPTNSCGEVTLMLGWANGNGIRIAKYAYVSSGNASIHNIYNHFNSAYGVSVSIGTPTVSISGDYVNFSFSFSDSQGSKMEKLKIHFEYFKQFYV